MAERRKLVAGNWKMNGLRSALPEVQAIVAGARGLGQRREGGWKGGLLRGLSKGEGAQGRGALKRSHRAAW